MEYTQRSETVPSYSTLPIVGLIGVALTALEGESKYGAYNYMKGMNTREALDHAIHHIMLYLCGDRSEPHLQHAAWGLLLLIEQDVVKPEISNKELPANRADAYVSEKRDVDPKDWDMSRREDIKTIIKLCEK